MQTKTVIGILLIVLGIVSFLYRGISYRSRERVLDLGPIQATAETTKTVPIQPLVGGLLVAAGVVLIAVGNKRS